MVTGGTPDGPVQLRGPVRLRAPARALDPRAVSWWRARCAVATVASTAALALVGALFVPLLLAAAVLCAVGGAAAAATLPGRWYRLHRWEITDRAVFTRSGYLRTSWRLAPIALISTADTRTGPLQRAFGLATLVLTTPAARQLTVAGLGNELAVEVARQLADRSAGLRGVHR